MKLITINSKLVPYDAVIRTSVGWYIRSRVPLKSIANRRINEYEKACAHFDLTSYDGKSNAADYRYEYDNGEWEERITRDKYIIRRSYGYIDDQHPWEYRTSLYTYSYVSRQSVSDERYAEYAYAGITFPFYLADTDALIDKCVTLLNTAWFETPYEWQTNWSWGSASARANTAFVSLFKSLYGYDPGSIGLSADQAYVSVYGSYIAITDRLPTESTFDIVKQLLQPKLTSELYQSIYSHYYEMCSQLKLSSNNIANLHDAAEIVRDLRHPLQLLQDAANLLKRKSVRQKAADAWMSYRYVYTTTKSDIDDAIDKLSKMHLTERTSFVVRDTISEPVHVQMKLYAEEDIAPISQLKELKINLQRWGLNPDLYTLWDMVPFSFIADWFLPIGDFLEKLQQYSWESSMPYKTQFLVSFKTDITFGKWSGKAYLRDLLDVPDGIFYSDSSTSAKTWIKRGLDILSMKS